MADLSLAIRVATETFGTEKLGDVERALGGIGSASAAAKQVLPGVAAATAGVTAAIGGSIAVAAEFEKTMDGALAVMDPADVNTFGASLENLALRLGKDTSFSAKEAASGIEELIKGGLTASDVLDGAAESTLALAAAGGVSLPDAATIAANALAQFNLKGSDMAHVSDLIAGAANASAIDVNQFKFSLQAAGAVASVTGFSFDDLAGAIAIMGKNGIAGSDAGTSLKTMMMSLQPATNKTSEEFNKLGLTGLKVNESMQWLRDRGIKPVEGSLEGLQDQMIRVMSDAEENSVITDEMTKRFYEESKAAGLVGNAFFTASGKVKPMAEVAEVLKVAMKDMTEQQRLASLEILFGSDAIRAGAILAKEGAGGFNDMAAAMGKVAATDVAAARLDNLNGSMEAMSGSMETVGITIGKILLPAARMLVEGFTGILNSFLNLSPEVQKFVAYGLVAAAAIGTVSTVALTLVAILPTLVAGFAALNTIAGVVGAVLTGPLLLAIGGVALAAFALYKAWDSNFGGIQDKTRAVVGFLTETAWPAIRSAFDFVTGTLLPAFASGWSFTMGKITGVLAEWKGAAQAVFDAIGAAFAFLTDTALPFLQTAWTATWAATGSILTSVWTMLAGTVFKPLFDTLALLQNVVLPALGEGFRLTTEAIGAVWTLLWETILLPGLTLLQSEWIRIWDAVSLKASEIWDAIQKKVGDTWKAIWTDGLAVGLKLLSDEWTRIWDAVSKKATEIWDAIFKKVTETWVAIWDNKLLPGLATLGTVWQTTWDNVGTALATAWTNILTKLDEWFGDMLRRFGQLAEDAFEAAKKIGTRIMEGIGDAIGSGVDGVINAIKGAIDRAIDAANAALRRMPSAPSIPKSGGTGGPNGADAPVPAIEDAGAWVTPMRGVVTQEFGKTPYSSIYPGGLHTGIDVSAAHGTSIVAARTGRVDIAGWDTTGYGNLVAITHPGGFRTLYGHLSDIAVRAGQEVLSGQVIGREGSTGNSSGPHVHFEVRQNGKTINPRSFVGFHTGGVIPGPMGSNVPILAHGGEVVLRPDQAQALGMGMRRGMGGPGAMGDQEMQRLAAYIANAVASAMANMSVRVAGSGFADAVVGAIVDGTRRGRLSPTVNEAYGSG